MNMKKTIAAVSAAAMAISAVATSASALETKSLTYNLVKHVVKDNDGEVTATASITITKDEINSIVKATVSSTGVVTMPTGATLFVGLDGVGGAWWAASGIKTHKITINAYETDENGQVTAGAPKTFSVNNHNWEDGWNGDANNTGITMSVSNAAGALKANTSYRFDITAVLKHDEVSLANFVSNGGSDIKVAYGSASGTEKTDVRMVFAGFSAYGKTADYDAPFTTANSGNTDIIAYLQDDENRLLKQEAYGTDSHYSYSNVRAVINDAIANYDSVQFTFNTATRGIKWGYRKYDAAGTKDTGHVDGFTSKNAAYMGASADVIDTTKGDTDKGTDVYGNASIFAYYNDDVASATTTAADTSYKSFARGIYNGYDQANSNTNNNANLGFWSGYGQEGGNFYGYDFTQQNLFGAALVVNEYQTMSLSDTDFFDWGTTSITFDWDAIYANTNAVPNAYASYIQSLKLVTSIEWYWDNMVVTATMDEADDATMGAGTESDEDTLDEGDEALDDGDISLEDEGEDEAANDVDETEEEDAGDVEEPSTDTVEATANPGTGNAPIALAVIPVALAAAAVVAKKRG